MEKEGHLDMVEEKPSTVSLARNYIREEKGLEESVAVYMLVQGRDPEVPQGLFPKLQKQQPASIG